jgi:AcrR family transcriptional regulator
MGFLDDQTGPTRRRGAALEATLLDSAWTELVSVGYMNLTMEGVAARARTSRQVLYRRWPNRAQLILAAMRRVLGAAIDDVADTGNLRATPYAAASVGHRQIRVHPKFLHGIMAEIPLRTRTCSWLKPR